MDSQLKPHPFDVHIANMPTSDFSFELLSVTGLLAVAIHAIKSSKKAGHRGSLL